MRSSTGVTLQDVAKEAGVAKMTASVVLNGSRSGTQVSEATRARIAETAKRLGYRPNGVARGLTRRRMDTIGVVAAVYGGINLYFMEIFNGVLNEAVKHDQSVNVLPVSGWGTSTQPRLLQDCDGRVDGVILVGPFGLEQGFLTSIRSHTPLVIIHADIAEPQVGTLNGDDEIGGFLTADHLVQLGHRRIAYVPGRLDIDPGARRRFEGYCRALAEHKIAYDDELVLLPGGYSEDTGYQRIARLLDTLPAWPAAMRPTAICCANDATAFGSIQALRERGLRVPDDMSVTGFDDVLSASVATTPLTTVRQPFLDLGGRALHIVLEQIRCRLRGEPEPAPSTEIFPVELIVRGTTAPRPASS